MYLVHQIIVCILYATLCIVFVNLRHMGGEGVYTSTHSAMRRISNSISHTEATKRLQRLSA